MKKIVTVELYFHCREDVDARRLARVVVGNFHGHLVATKARLQLLGESYDYKDLQFTGHSWNEKEVKE